MAEETKEQQLETVSLNECPVSKPITDINSMYRRFMLTINNPEQTDEDFEKYLQSLEHMKFYSFNREQAPTTGTIHFQLFAIFSSPKRFSTVKSYFPTAHIECCKKSSSTCLEYTTKSETRVSGPYTWGTFEDQGSRSDIKSLNELIKAGATDKQIRELLPNSYTRYSTYISNERQKMLAEELDSEIKQDFLSVYIYGNTQTGKTSDLFLGYRNKAYFVSDYLKNPWDAYRNQDIVVMDDFNCQFNLDMMKKYIDVFPIELSSRYNNKYGNYTKVFIVSNKPISYHYSYERTHERDKWNSFRKRVHFVLHYENNKIYVEDATKPLEKLRQLLPKHMIEKLDYTKVGFTAPTTERKEVVHKFEIIDDDLLPF